MERKDEKIPKLGSSPITLTYIPISMLKLDPRNPRVHSMRQVRQIARSIDAFGFNVPVLIDANNRVLAGHGRILACKLLGWTEVPTVRLAHLTEAQARAFMIADNRLTENSTWDDQLLGEQLRDLAALDLDFSLEATGFEMGEIDLRIEQFAADLMNEPDSADDLSGLSKGRWCRDSVTCGGWANTASIAGARWSLLPMRR